MIKCLYKFINVVIFLSISYHACSQNLPIETNKIIEKFKLNFEKNNFQFIIDDYEKIKSEKRFSMFRNDEVVLIRYLKFCSEIYLGNFNQFDETNYYELLSKINIIENQDEKTKYIVCIYNNIEQIHQYYPEWSIKQTDKILNFKNYNNLSNWKNIKYNLLYIQLNSYNRLNNFKAAEEIRLKLESYINTREKKLTSLLEKAYYNIGISQFKTAHEHLMSADTLLVKYGASPNDSVSFFIVWAKFYNSIYDTINANQSFSIAYEIAEKNKMEDMKYSILYEMVLLEKNLKTKVKILEKLISDNNCKDFSMRLAISNSLAVSYNDLGQNKRALDMFMMIYNLEDKYFEKVHNKTILNLAYFLEKDNQFKESEKYYSIAYSDLIKKINSNFIFLSNYEKSSYFKKENWLFNSLNSYNVKAYQSYPKSSELTFNANLISKSLLLETIRELDEVIIQSTDKKLKLQFTEMKQLRRLVSKMQSEGSDKKEIITRYNSQADSLDKILVNKVGEYANAKRKFEITWKDVQSNLLSIEAAIEFARYYDNTDSIYRYMALVVRPGFEYPKMVKLGSELDIKNASSQKEFSELYNYVWKGIDSLLDGVKTIYYSPVGELNNVSFSALINENKKNNQSEKTGSNWSYLMDHYELHQLTTTRYLADGTLKKNKTIPLSIKLIGGVNYNDLPIVKDSVKKTESTEDFAFHINLQNEMKDSQLNRSGKLNYLKGSEIEVTDISKVLSSEKWTVSASTGKDASEYQFKEELNKTSPGVIHIATHGFAFPEKEKNEEKHFQNEEKSNYKVSEDPMVRCGLMLSGANISWSGDQKKMIETSGDDGILTAAEVANLDLSNTKLVVLSACETGLGKIESSEGTFGLKRGFKLAGVDKIIVSLWKVPDNESMELMTLFYSELAKTKDIDSSFNKAQKTMRNRYPYEPEKWSGFVLVR